MVLSFRVMIGYGRPMGSYTVELIRDGKTVRRAELHSGSMAEAAKTWGPLKDGLGREPTNQDFIRVTHFASGRTSWFNATG